jgi:hypothetical protein
MNTLLSFKPLIQKTNHGMIIQRSCKRLASTAAHSNNAHGSNKINYIQKHWLSDPSVYPLMVIMGSAITFMSRAGIHALRDYKDVKLTAAHRNSPLQNWGYEKESSAVETWVGRSNAFPPEGLGLNHDEWMKSKEQYQKMKLQENQ